MLGALSEAARQELGLVTQVTGGEPALAALSAMLAPLARDIASLVQAEVLAQPASLGKAADLAELAAAARAAARAVLETLRQVASAEDAAGCEACSVLRGLEQGALASARRLWRFLEQPGGTGPPDARIAFPPDAASNELAEATAAALRRIARVPELGDIFFEQAAGGGPFAAAASGPGRLLASVTSVLGMKVLHRRWGGRLTVGACVPCSVLFPILYRWCPGVGGARRSKGLPPRKRAGRAARAQLCRDAGAGAWQDRDGRGTSRHVAGCQ